MSDYLPKDATIEEACNWLQAKTGQTWVLPRLLEWGLTPHFWLDYKPGYPVVYGGRIEGYQTRMVFQGDLSRLESDRGDALVNMLTTHDGNLLKVEPALRVPLSELKFKREEIEETAAIIGNRGASALPLQRAAAQDKVILAAIRQAGYDPLALPKNEPGRPGVRAEISAALVGTNSLFPKDSTVFKKAWERLREHGDIADKV